MTDKGLLFHYFAEQADWTLTADIISNGASHLCRLVRIFIFVQ